jgi:hypothetical protein
MNRSTLLIALALTGIGTTACSSGAQRGASAPTSAQQEIQESEVPAPLRVPTGNKLTMSLDGSGVQIYQCGAGAWSLLQPAATLSDHGRPVGLHFKGPIWVSTVDGSQVGAAPIATVNQSGAVSELLLKANQNQGAGTFSKVSYVQRLRTQGGLAPSGACADGAQLSVPYTAVYRFWSPDGQPS